MALEANFPPDSRNWSTFPASATSAMASAMMDPELLGLREPKVPLEVVKGEMGDDPAPSESRALGRL